MTALEELQGLLQLTGSSWEVIDWDIDRPLKEIAPKNGFRQYEAGDRMSITVHLKKKGVRKRCENLFG